MNHFTFTQMIQGYLLAANARRPSPNALRNYQNTFRLLVDFLDDDPLISEITTKQVEGFLAAQNGVSKKTLRNFHTGLSAL